MFTTSEDELVHRAQHGDRSAFAELVRRHHAHVIGVVYRLCGDPHLAEDAAQEAFVRAWLNLNSYRPLMPWRNWLYRIAVNVALDTLRRERHTLAINQVPEARDRQPDPQALLEQKEREHLVRQAILALPPTTRAVLVLREYGGLSYREIAEALDIPLGTVMSRLSTARQRLREHLAPWLAPQEVPYE
ncbi:RNA polymerase sigma factor [uncultured Thermanaerothrix sp.]|uniref:RNA polymerase sigma factor n=1 Tax=uncultured Thermanaerothrix sp. TaxID=1195149 RepID=UPI0026213350|nr:sigma-70 family RNA polymerase sigma factor [uncultured Thermanaerothrix sp.]